MLRNNPGLQKKKKKKKKKEKKKKKKKKKKKEKEEIFLRCLTGSVNGVHDSCSQGCQLEPHARRRDYLKMKSLKKKRKDS